eukprot:Gb_39113 [translate_table: standard]
MHNDGTWIRDFFLLGWEQPWILMPRRLQSEFFYAVILVLTDYNLGTIHIYLCCNPNFYRILVSITDCTTVFVVALDPFRFKEAVESTLTTWHPSHRQLDSPAMRITEDTVLQVLEDALTKLYGLVGGALLMDLIDFKEETGTVTLRCRKRICIHEHMMVVLKANKNAHS